MRSLSRWWPGNESANEAWSRRVLLCLWGMIYIVWRLWGWGVLHRMSYLYTKEGPFPWRPKLSDPAKIMINIYKCWCVEFLYFILISSGLIFKLWILFYQIHSNHLNQFLVCWGPNPTRRCCYCDFFFWLWPLRDIILYFSAISIETHSCVVRSKKTFLCNCNTVSASTHKELMRIRSRCPAGYICHRYTIYVTKISEQPLALYCSWVQQVITMVDYLCVPFTKKITCGYDDDHLICIQVYCCCCCCYYYYYYYYYENESYDGYL